MSVQALPNGVDQTLSGRIGGWAERRPQAPAVIDASGRWTCAELDELSDRLVTALVRRGIRPGQPIGVLLERGRNVALSALALLKGGFVYLPLDPEYPQARIEQVLGDAGAALLIHDDQSLHQVPGKPEAVNLAVLLAEPREAPGPNGSPAPGRPDDDATAYLIYTSGSTGRPKGVVVSRRALHLHVADCLRAFDLTSEDTYLQVCSAGFDPSVQDIFTALAAGATLVFSPPRPPDAAQFLQLVQQHRISVTLLPTAYWSYLARQLSAVLNPSGDMPLRLVMVAGEAMATETARYWHKGPLASSILVNAYGPTEAVILATIHRVTEQDLASSSPTVPIGTVLGSRDLLVMDDDLQPVTPGQIGELWVGGACVASGYLNRPELTADRFVSHPLPEGTGPGRYYRTGDRVQADAAGDLVFLGRTDNQVKFRGYRVELGEIETAISATPGVVESRVLVLDPRGVNPRLRAVSVVDGSHPVDTLTDAVLARLRAQLPAYMVPSQLLFLPAFPLNAHGKVDNSALEQLPSSLGPVSARGPAAGHPLEEVLAEIVPGADLDLTFAEVGVSSLALLTFAGRAAERGWTVDRESAASSLSVRDVLNNAVRRESTSGRRAVRPGSTAADSLALAPVQRRVLAEIGAAADHWNASLLLDVDATVDLDSLSRHVVELIDENPVLTAVVDRHAGRLLTRLRSAAGLVTVHALPDDAAVIGRATQIQKSLSVSAGPLSQAALLSTPDRCRLLLVAHRVVCDGHSLTLFADRLQARLAGHAGSPESDYLDWSRAVWSARSDAQLLDARIALVEEAQIGALPPAFGGLTAVHRDADVVRAKIDRPESGALTGLVAIQAVGRALARWSGSQAIRFDVQHHGRLPVPGVDRCEGIIGPFTCAVPLVVRLGRRPGLVLPDPLAVGLLTYPAAGAGLNLPRSAIQFNHRVGLLQTAEPSARLLSGSRLSAGPEKGAGAQERYLLKIATDGSGADLRVRVVYNAAIHTRTQAEHLLAVLGEELAETR